MKMLYKNDPKKNEQKKSVRMHENWGGKTRSPQHSFRALVAL